MTKILFPTDFSTTAQNAFLYALSVAQAKRAEIVVLHAYQAPILSGAFATDADIIQQVYDTHFKNETENFESRTKDLLAFAGSNGFQKVPLSFVLKQGDLVDTIQELLKEISIKFVIMGTEGHGGIEKKIFGSNTLNVFKAIDIPVISIPPSVDYKKIEHIGFATLFKEYEKRALRRVIDFAKSYPASIEVVHIKEAGKNVAEEYNLWKKEFSADNLSFHIEDSSSTEEALLTYIQKNDIDVLAMVRRNQNFFERLFTGSLTKNMSNHLSKPIIVLHSSEIS